jgi:DNA-binding transcriptional LysR family regulator
MKNSEILSPQTFLILQAVANSGSFAGAARQLGLVPSALSYRIRQIEESLDVLLFDRSSRQAVATPAGLELLAEGQRILNDIEAVAQRVKRVATGWESQLTIALDDVFNPQALLELCQRFYELKAPTRIRIRSEVLSGTMESLTSGQSDLVIGVGEHSEHTHIKTKLLGKIKFIFVVAPHHPLAQLQQPIADQIIVQHRVIAVADTALKGAGISIGLLTGQEVLTVPNLKMKLNAQILGLGVGFLPEHLAREAIKQGQLIELKVQRSDRFASLHYAWRSNGQFEQGRALKWWLEQIANPATAAALLGHI